ncbi:MAG TPA: iron-sulfur cluster repair di-iron protein [Rhodothermales bacterium]|nr:iron-sulfur cluster repair di-iron protein [Rhodothermales bacterium]
MHQDTLTPDFTDLAHRTVGELVAEDYRKAEVFKRYGIDFCCGGGRTVQDACAKKGVDYEELASSLRTVAASERTAPALNFKEWDPGFLADYIVNIHHVYVRENLPLLKQFTTKVARVHGEAHPEVVEIARLFDELAQELDQHMIKEETVLFPHVKRLTTAYKQGTTLTSPPFGTVQNPIRMMEHEHDQAGAIMHEIRRLSNDFTPPEGACTTYRVTYAKLQEFEDDLHQHVHLENNILFPKTAALESKVAA